MQSRSLFKWTPAYVKIRATQSRIRFNRPGRHIESFLRSMKHARSSCFDPQFFLRFTKQCRIGNLAHRNLPRQFSFLDCLIDDREQTLVGNTAVEIVDFESGIVGSRRQRRRCPAPIDQRLDRAFAVLTYETIGLDQRLDSSLDLVGSFLEFSRVCVPSPTKGKLKSSWARAKTLKPSFLASSSPGGEMTTASTTPSLRADSRAAAGPSATTLISFSASTPKCLKIIVAATWSLAPYA